MGLLATLIVFGRRATKSQIKQIEGKPGASLAVLRVLKRRWRTDEMVAFTKQQDVVHRLTGPPGIVLLGEGDPHRVKQLMTAEQRRHQRVVSDVPIHLVVVGYGEGQVPLGKLARHLTKMKKQITPGADDRHRRPAARHRRLAPGGAAAQGPGADQHEGHARPDARPLTFARRDPTGGWVDSTGSAHGEMSRSGNPLPREARTTHMTTTPGSGASTRPSVAVVGAGIAGLSAAHALQATHRVTLLEAEDRLGGHAHTHTVDLPGGGQVAVDSGFIVLNDRTYPELRRLFADLGVPTRPTEMSMSVTCAGCGLGYVGGRSARGIFAQKRRLVDPRFWRLLLSVRRFQKAALALLESDEDLTYGDFLAREGFDDFFVQHYALPIVSCVWSMGHEEALGYPASYLFAFLRNHGFLVLRDAPTWHTVVGGSRTYVEAVAARLDVVRADARVTAITRTPDGCPGREPGC